jgi:hypothetical protein
VVFTVFVVVFVVFVDLTAALPMAQGRPNCDPVRNASRRADLAAAE